MKSFVVLLLILAVNGVAQDTATINYVDSLLKRPKTCILVRESGEVFGVFTLPEVGLYGPDTVRVIIPDSSLVASRIAHDDAIATARRSAPQMYFDEKFLTPEQKALIEKK